MKFPIKVEAPQVYEGPKEKKKKNLTQRLNIAFARDSTSPPNRGAPAGPLRREFNLCCPAGVSILRENEII